MNKRSYLFASLLLGLLTVVCYWPITRHGFVVLDDPKYIYDNPHVTQGLTWSGIAWAFTTGYASNWHPVTWISHMLDYQAYGLNAGGHHFTNLLLHAINAVLLFLLVSRLTGAFWRSALVAALFAWHPTHVESVAWAAERKDVLSTFFFLLTLGAYAQYVMAKSRVEGRAARAGDPSTLDARRSTQYFLLALFFFALGLMSKPMLVTLPFVLLLLDYWPLRRLSFASLHHSITPSLRLIGEKLPFFGLSVGASVVTYCVQKAGGAVSSLTTVPFGERVANALVAYVRYVSKTIWPADLSVFYPLPNHWHLMIVIASAVVLLVLSWLVIRSSGLFPYLPVGWFWFLGTLVPTIGLVQVGSQSMADRYLYIPSIGLFLVAAWGICDLSFKRRRSGQTITADCGDGMELDADSRALLARPPVQESSNGGESARAQPRLNGNLIAACAAVVALMACLACTSFQIGFWHDEETLFRHAMHATPDNYLAYDHLAKVCESGGRKEEALNYYDKLLRLKPRYAEGHYNLGTLLMGMGKLNQAEPHLQTAVTIRPQWAQAHSNLGISLLRVNKADQAIGHLDIASRLDPRDPDAYINLGVALLSMNRVGEAVNAFSKAVLLAPNVPETQFLLALALSRERKSVEALLQAEKARDLALACGRRELALKANELVRVCQSESPIP